MSKALLAPTLWRRIDSSGHVAGDATPVPARCPGVPELVDQHGRAASALQAS